VAKLGSYVEGDCYSLIFEPLRYLACGVSVTFSFSCQEVNTKIRGSVVADLV